MQKEQKRYSKKLFQDFKIQVPRKLEQNSHYLNPRIILTSFSIVRNGSLFPLLTKKKGGGEK